MVDILIEELAFDRDEENLHKVLEGYNRILSMYLKSDDVERAKIMMSNFGKSICFTDYPFSSGTKALTL